jgi:hypothetical protein
MKKEKIHEAFDIPHSAGSVGDDRHSMWSQGHTGPGSGACSD